MSFLQGPPNPKTLVPLILPPRMLDFEVWRDSSRATNNFTNSASRVNYLEASGYDTPISSGIDLKDDSMPEIGTKLLSNINPLYVQALAGPNSFTVQKPSGVYANQGLIDTTPIGFQTKFGVQGGDYQLYLQSESPLIDFEKNPLDSDVRDAIMSNYPKTFVPPNFIERNNLNLDLNVNGAHNDLRSLAQAQFILDSNNQRSSLQNSLMRKRNSEMWQSRLAPLSGWKN